MLESLESRRLLSADGLTLHPDRFELLQNDRPIEIDLFANDIFADDYAGDRQITGTSPGSLGGRIEIRDDGVVRYSPPADRSGTEVFRYTVDGLASADVSIDIRSPLRDFVRKVHLDQFAYQFDLLAGSSFPGDYQGEQKITQVSESSQGADLQVSGDGKTVTYAPRIGATGNDTFHFVVDNRFIATAQIQIENPLGYDRFEVIESSETVVIDVLENDFLGYADPGFHSATTKANATITHVLPDHGEFEADISEDGRLISFRPKDGYSGSASFRYVVNSQFEQRVQVTVHRPVQDDRVNADQDGGVHTFSLLANDQYWSSLSQQTIRVADQITSVTQGDQGGTVSISGDRFRVAYRPADGFIGTETFEYTANGRWQGTVRVVVSQPVRDDHVYVVVGAETSIDVLGNDFASNSGVGTITEVGESAIGATISTDGNVIRYRPPEDSLTRESPVYRDRFTYRVNDQFEATVSVSLRSATSPDWVAVDSFDTVTISPLDNDHFSSFYVGDRLITDVSQPSDGGTATISDNGRQIEYTPGSNREQFSYTVDGKFSEQIFVRPIGRLRPDTAIASQNGDAIRVHPLENDFRESSYLLDRYGPYDGPRVLTGVSGSAANAEIAIDNGVIVYTPAADFFGRDTFSYTVDDFLTETVTVNVIRHAADDVVHVDVDSGDNRLNLLANDILGARYRLPGRITDVLDSDAGAEVSISADGRNVIYTPPAGFEGRDQFVYQIDGQSKATVTVVVGKASSPVAPFSTWEAYRDFVVDRSVDQAQGYFGNEGVSVLDSTERLSVASVGYSETNVQVEGVDEDDIVETDGNFIYSLQGNLLTIVRSLPADDLELVSRTEIEGSPTGMYLNGDRLTVLSSEFSYDDPLPLEDRVADISFWPGPRSTKTIATVIDVANRESPRVVQRTVLDGSLTTSRRIGDQVFLVLNSRQTNISPEWVCDDGGGFCQYESEEEFRTRVTNDFSSLIERTLPNYQSYDAAGNAIRSGLIVTPEDIYRSDNDASTMTVVVSLNMASDEPGISASSGVLTPSSSDIYATAEHLYVFSPFREAVENERWTRITQFSWNGQSGAIDYAAVGSVPGKTLNQFSADEHDGLLRVVTEISNSGTGNHSGQNETALFVLQNDSGVLEFRGSLQNLSPGENVKSVRFFQDRAFITTFRTVDPLHAIDLQNPEAPRAVGHVTLPGFSSYMQFISADRLLTVGTNTATGFGGRVVVTLFDVGDLEFPRTIEQYNLPRFSTSEANRDHHAFGWFAPHEVLAVPMSRRFVERFDDDGDDYPEASRVVVEDALTLLHVGVDSTSGEEGISSRGRIDHDAAVMRSVYIGQHIYSVGLDGIRVVRAGEGNTIVDELLFDHDSLPPIPFQPRSEWRLDSGLVRSLQATAMNLDQRDLVFVTHETKGERLEVVLRHGERHLRFQGTTPEDLALLDESFQFLDRWHNDVAPLDVNDDGEVTAIDALVVINELNRRGQSGLPVDRALRQIDAAVRFADTNNDGRVSAIDALRIINEMRRRSVAESEYLFTQAEQRDRLSTQDDSPRDQPSTLF